MNTEDETIVDRHLRLSAWVSGDVARARELAEEIADASHGWIASRKVAAEIVALLTPPDTEGDA